MINHQLALMKREVWEHRSIYVTPAAIASIVTLGVMAMLVFASGFAAELDVAIFGAQNIAGDPERSGARAQPRRRPVRRPGCADGRSVASEWPRGRSDAP